MDKAGLPQTSEDLSISSEQLSEFSSAPVDDIPAAVRENAEIASRFSLKPGIVWGLGGLGILTLLGLPIVLWQTRSPIASVQASQTTASGAGETSGAEQTSASRQISTPRQTTKQSITEQAAPDSANTSDADPSSANATDALLGHLPYAEAPASELVAVGDGSIMLRQAAAEKFEAMVAAAKAEGVNLVPLSGFRSVDQQEGVFFDVKAERGENATTRAEVSAPPGYSEHHTGYAVDLGDGYFPDADLRESFENTPAFQWLQENAGYYSFELSFPKDNQQNVSYEPWHWRFVGDRGSLETFYRARGTTETSSADEETSSASP